MSDAQSSRNVSTKGIDVSEVLWCDRGNHLFSANTEHKTWTEKQSYQEVQDGKTPQRTDVCKDCMAGGTGTDVVKELMAPRPRTAADVAAAKGYDPEYVEWLEKQNGVGDNK